MSTPYTGYVPPLCPGADPGADWQEMGWCCHDCAAIAHLAWCPNHPTGTGPDQPVPYTLTPKADAALDHPQGPVMHCGCGYADCSTCTGYGWACLTCARAFFGTRPEHGQCPGCQETRP